VLTAAETASALGIAIHEIGALLQSGKLKGFQVGDDYRIRVSSVESITGPLVSEVEEGLEGGVAQARPNRSGDLVMMYVPLGFNNRVQILMVALASGKVRTFVLTPKI